MQCSNGYSFLCYSHWLYNWKTCTKGSLYLMLIGVVFSPPLSLNMVVSSSNSSSESPGGVSLSPQHQQLHGDGPHQLPQGGGQPQHLPRRPAEGNAGPARLRLQRAPRLPLPLPREQPAPATGGFRNLQQVHLQVRAQVRWPGGGRMRLNRRHSVTPAPQIGVLEG